jgi:hypothetical protein
MLKAIPRNTKLRWFQSIAALELIQSTLMSLVLLTSVPSSKLMPYQHRVSMNSLSGSISLPSRVVDI